jgi:hypothetical protein
MSPTASRTASTIWLSVEIIGYELVSNPIWIRTSKGKSSLRWNMKRLGGHERPNHGFGDGIPVPVPVKSAVSEHCIIRDRNVQVGQFSLQNVSGDLRISYRWDKQAMLVQVGHFSDQKEHLVPTRFTVGPQVSHGAIESCPGTVGISIVKGFQKFICFAGKGELGIPPLLIARAMRRNDFPVSVIERGAEIVNNIPANNRSFIHYGFVMFSDCGTFSGVCICFDNKRCRSLFLEKFVKFTDVLRGPTNFEQCAICHA